ncbi:MAG: cell wall-binding repeat-containing protein, partial [Oscillospiraceae bacterium]|nr:cell wall-binding repeat-containing protein [Oscillospiraceae bacterium]
MSLLLLMSAIPLSVGVSATPSATTGIIRLGGASRIQTAVTICNAGWGNLVETADDDDPGAPANPSPRIQYGADTVVLASGRIFADALAGGPLAAALNAPILLTNNPVEDKLEDYVLTKIRGLGATNVVILGGGSSVSDGVANSIIDKGIAVERLAGANRYETSIAVANRLQEIKGSPSIVFIANGADFPDALSVESPAAILNAPIVFQNGNAAAIHPATAAYLQDLASPAGGLPSTLSKIYLSGGSATLTDAFKANVQTATNLLSANVKRLSGSNRYATSLAIWTEFWQDTANVFDDDL